MHILNFDSFYIISFQKCTHLHTCTLTCTHGQHIHKTNLDNTYQHPPARYKNFCVQSGIEGDFKFYTQKKVLLSICRSLHSLIQHVCILQASVTIHSMHSVVLGALGRYMVIENSVLFGQGKHYKAMPSTQSQCNIKTSTGMPYMYRHYK